jgi:hypothetical protein
MAALVSKALHLRTIMAALFCTAEAGMQPRVLLYSRSRDATKDEGQGYWLAKKFMHYCTVTTAYL